MKNIKYNLCTKTEAGNILSGVTMPWNEINEELAKKEAYNGEYTIEDDGIEEIIVPTTDERVEALEAALLEMILGGIKNG